MLKSTEEQKFTTGEPDQGQTRNPTDTDSIGETSAPDPDQTHDALEPTHQQAPPDPHHDDQGQTVIGPSANSKDALSAPDRRFEDHQVRRIVENWRLRQDLVRAMTRLSLQAQAILRRHFDDDKKKAAKFFAIVKADFKKGKAPVNTEDAKTEADQAYSLTHAYLLSMVPLEEQRKKYEVLLAERAKELPIAHMVDEIKGFSYLGLGKVVGELGDMSAYQKGIAGVWKRAGLAVIDGERQRKCTNAEKAKLHGYDPQRRSVFWNIMDSMFRHQGTAEKGNATRYRLYYEQQKEKELDKALTDDSIKPYIAERRARRHTTKLLIKDLYVEWCKVVGVTPK